jgi:SP family general alpha glucoside:H+ symporter-like MFS transporter
MDISGGPSRAQFSQPQEVRIGDLADVNKNLDYDTIKHAARGDEAEHTSTIKQAYATHKKAIWWSMALSGA